MQGGSYPGISPLRKFCFFPPEQIKEGSRSTISTGWHQECLSKFFFTVQ